MGVAAKADTAVERGLKVVREHCTRCHVVPGINPYGGIGSTPSFSAMKWLDDWAYRFEVFYILPPHPSLVRIEGVASQEVTPCQPLAKKSSLPLRMLMTY